VRRRHRRTGRGLALFLFFLGDISLGLRQKESGIFAAVCDQLAVVTLLHHGAVFQNHNVVGGGGA